MSTKEGATRIKDDEWTDGWGSAPADHLNRLVCDHLYFEGRGDALRTFMAETGTRYECGPALDCRTRIRQLIERGSIPEARSALIDFDIELVDTDDEINRMLVIQCAMEMVADGSEEKALGHIESNLRLFRESNAREELKDFLEYLVFRSGDDVLAGRKKLARAVNERILRKHEPRQNRLAEMMSEIVRGERVLADRCDFPTFSSICGGSAASDADEANGAGGAR